MKPPPLLFSKFLPRLRMTQTYPRTDKEKLNLIARTAFERTQPRHQETLRQLRLLAALV